MKQSKLRRQIAWEAARLMYDRQESEYYRAKQKAAKRLGQGWVKPADLPSNAEIRDQVQALARMHEGDSRTTNLRAMRLAALRMMRVLDRWRPRLIGSVLTGHVREGSDIDLHVFADNVESVAHLLDTEGMAYTVEKKHVRKQGEQRVYTHVHVQGQFAYELTVYPTDKAHHVFTSSITGKPIERASTRQLEQFLAHEYPEIDIQEALAESDAQVDRFQLYEALLVPLESVRQDPRYHPEGDALYHSLQVFDHGCDHRAYDEEFLTAALLHDVGKAIDPRDHVTAGLEALDGFITERTAWLIQHHMLCHDLREGRLGARKHRRLRENENYQDLLLLGECDRAGRQPGAEAPELDAALDYLRDIGDMFG